MKFLTQAILSCAAISAMIFSTTSHADSKQVCGHTMNYTPSAPAANVPQNVKAYLGVWQGQLSISATNGMCVVFVIQAVDASGTAQVIHAYGDAEKPTMGGRVGVTKLMAGQIINGTFVFNTSSARVYNLTLDPSNPDNMAGVLKSADHGGTFQVNLFRVQRFQ